MCGIKQKILSGCMLNIALPVDNEHEGPRDHEEHVQGKQNYPGRNAVWKGLDKRPS